MPIDDVVPNEPRWPLWPVTRTGIAVEPDPSVEFVELLTPDVSAPGTACGRCGHVGEHGCMVDAPSAPESV